MKKKKTYKILTYLALAGIVLGGGIGLYMFNMPHRDVQSTSSDYQLTASQLVSEFLKNENTANQKYLSEDGESKIIEVTGTVKTINTNYNNLTVVLLKEEKDKAGVSCTFDKTTNDRAKDVKPESKITIKGVIRAGAIYDEDLELYENVILEKCDITKY